MNSKANRGPLRNERGGVGGEVGVRGMSPKEIFCISIYHRSE